MLVDGIKYQGIYLREGQRVQAWASVAPWSKQSTEPTDIMRYPWDEIDDVDDAPELTMEEIKAQQEEIAKLINESIANGRRE